MVWIKGYEGYYKMDKDGVVYSVEREYTNKLGRTYKVPFSIRGPVKHPTGYCVIGLYKNGTTKTYRLHRLIAETLIPNPENKPFVNHKDGDKRNNHPSNLEWCSPQENTDHAIKSGLFNTRGTANPSSKLTFEDIDDCYLLVRHGIPLKEIADLFNCLAPTTIVRAIKRELNVELPPYKGVVRPNRY